MTSPNDLDKVPDDPVLAALVETYLDQITPRILRALTQHTNQVLRHRDALIDDDDPAVWVLSGAFVINLVPFIFELTRATIPDAERRLELAGRVELLSRTALRETIVDACDMPRHILPDDPTAFSPYMNGVWVHLQRFMLRQQLTALLGDDSGD